MEQIVTYFLAYRQDQTVDLCAACAESDDEGGRGTLGAVSHGQRAGDCEGRVHAIDARADELARASALYLALDLAELLDDAE